MHILDSHEFVDLYRGDKDLRLGMELCKSFKVRYSMLIPDVASPADQKFFKSVKYPKHLLPPFPEGMKAEYLKAKLIYFNKGDLTHGGFFQFAPGYMAAIKRAKPDLIFENPFTTLTPRSYMTYTAAKFNRIPMVYVDPADIVPKGVVKQILNKIEKKVINYSSAVITYNPLGKIRFIKEYDYPEYKIHVIPKPVDIKQFSPGIGRDEIREQLNIGDRFVISYMGRLSSNKGCFELMKAAKRLNDMGKSRDLFFIFAGGNISSKDAMEIQKLRDKFKLKNVHFTGPVSHIDMCKYQAASDIVAYPIHNNPPGFSTVLAESMAMGKALIVGNRDCEIATPIRHGVNGKTIESGNVEELIQAILELKDDESMRKKFEIAVRKYAEEYMDWEKVAQKYFTIFKMAVER